MKKKLKSLLGFILAMAMVLSMAPQLTLAARADSTSTEPPVMEADDDSWDIPLADLTVSCGDYEPDGGANEGPADLAVDNNNATMWHTDWYGTSRDNHWFQFNVTGDYAVCGLRYLPRQTGNSNGTITEYEILVSDDGVNFRSVSSGNWAADSTWKIAQFSGEKVSYVRLVALNAETDNDYVFASAAEIRLTYLPTEVSDADKTALNALIAECELIEQGNYTARSWQQFQSALQTAQIISANAYASQGQVDEAYEALAQAKAGLKETVEGEGIQKIFHLDCGRKYFSKDWIIALLNELSVAGYTHLQLAFGNNGFRFILDDMTIEANGTSYTSDAIKEGIKIGNDNYGALTGYATGDAHALTEAEMDEIIAHGKSVGVEIIPHLNMPGHMSALLDAMVHVGISDAHFTGRVQSDSSVNLNNEIALNFMQALVDEYAAYFSEKGCEYFHIGADEYANDAYNGAMGFPSMGATLYQKFADFVNENAAIVMDHGMTPRAWNDGIYYGSYTSEFDSNIEITYWSSGWSGYTLAKASTLDEKGHGLINTHGDYYYILGKNDRFTSGSSTQHDPNLYTECAGYDLNQFMDGSVIEYPVGGMFCVWADYPGAETETEVAASIRLVLRAMAMRMDGLEIDDLDTSVVPGGFNEDGSINESEIHEHSFGEWTVTTESTCTEAGVETRTCECGESETREIAALGHNYVDGVCTRCGEADPDYVAPVADEVIRLSGTGRCETAFLAADELKAALNVEEFDAIIIASGNEFPDALAGSYLAAVKGAPILLYRAGHVDDNALYIEENLAEGGIVYILGGTAAVPQEMEDALAGYNVKRIKGTNRFETNLAILEEAGVGEKDILIATGHNFADSLSASATGLPILLVDNRKTELTESQQAFLAGLEGKNDLVVLGGTAAVNEDLYDELSAYGKIERVKGANREATSVAIAEKYFQNPDTALLACSRNFPDGLCGGPLAYAMGAPLLLTNTGEESTTAAYIAEKEITSGYVLGGTGALSDEVVRAVFAMEAADEIIVKK